MCDPGYTARLLRRCFEAISLLASRRRRKVFNNGENFALVECIELGNAHSFDIFRNFYHGGGKYVLEFVLFIDTVSVERLDFRFELKLHFVKEMDEVSRGRPLEDWGLYVTHGNTQDLPLIRLFRNTSRHGQTKPQRDWLSIMMDCLLVFFFFDFENSDRLFDWLCFGIF